MEPLLLLGVLSEIDKLKRMWPLAWKTSLNAQPRLQAACFLRVDLSTPLPPHIIKGHGYYDNTENTSNDRRQPNWLRRAGSWNWKFFIVIMREWGVGSEWAGWGCAGSSFGFIVASSNHPVCPQKALVISASRLHLRSLSCGTSHLSFWFGVPLPVFVVVVVVFGMRN